MGHFTEERLSHLAHLIQGGLLDGPLVSSDEQGRILKEIKRGMSACLQIDDQVDSLVRQKIGTLKKGILEGSPEWDVLYRKYFEEELHKHR